MSVKYLFLLSNDRSTIMAEKKKNETKVDLHYISDSSVKPKLALSVVLSSGVVNRRGGRTVKNLA